MLYTSNTNKSVNFKIIFKGEFHMGKKKKKNQWELYTKTYTIKEM